LGVLELNRLVVLGYRVHQVLVWSSSNQYRAKEIRYRVHK